MSTMTAARKFWPEGDPLAGQLIIGERIGSGSEDATRQIVGIVGDVEGSGVNHNPQPAVYVPFGADSGSHDGIKLARRTDDVRGENPGRHAHAKPGYRKRIGAFHGRAAGRFSMGRVRSMDDVLVLSTAHRFQYAFADYLRCVGAAFGSYRHLWAKRVLGAAAYL